jgi:serine protease Do
LPDFSDIAARNGPAVVNISVTGSTRVGYEQQGDDAAAADDPLFEFFRRFQSPQGRSSVREVPVRGHGSGFIVSTDGVIMTNAHVVRGASEVMVKLTDRREFRAKVLGSDSKTDIAILKIEAQNLPQVALAANDTLRVGEWVLAIGSPFGFDSTVTAGVVSAKGRSLPDDSNVPFIQTDVAINPGNSGGPLFNARGEVVGVNSQIFSQTGGYQGVSFAIPIDVANHVRRQIVATGKVAHAKLGVTVQEVNQSFADSFKLASPEGALVANVEPGGPADKAGLQAGDVVRSMNGRAIIGSVDLPAQVGGAAPGDEITLDLWRDGKMMTLAATLGDAMDKVQGTEREGASSGKLKLGLALRPLQAAELRASSVRSGLLVEDADGAAANAGVQRGDVLLSINGNPVGTLAEVRELLARSTKSVALLVLRGNDRIFIPVKLG